MKYTIIVILSITLLAGFLRFYRLGSVPPSLDWDEVSLAYNAWALSETGRDEFGNSWPLSIRSFGDYKPPLYTYLLIPSLRLFGRTEFAIRFPSAMAGILTVLVTYFFALEILKRPGPASAGPGLSTNKKGSDLSERSDPSTLTGLLASFLLAISPWHLQFSRIAFEANVGLFFYVASLWLLLRWIHRGGWTVVWSALAIAAALMSYHSIRVVGVLGVLGILGIYGKETVDHIKKHYFPTFVAGGIAVLTVVLIGYTVLVQGVGQSRLAETSFLTIDELLTESRSRTERFPGSVLDRAVNHRYFVYGKQFLSGYLDHYNLRFFFLDGDRIDRHRTPSVGLLYWWELPLLIVGFMSLMRPMGLMDSKTRYALLSLFLLAPVASALTSGTPSAVRSLVFLPVLQIVSAIGGVGALGALGKLGKLRKKISILLLTAYCLLLTAEIIHYFHQYYVHMPIEYAKAWQYGYKEVVERVMKEKDRYQQIVITTSYDQPYIYFLWYGNFDPSLWTNDGEFNKRFDRFVFRSVERQEMQDWHGSLVIGHPLEFKGAPSVWDARFPDGSVAFQAAAIP